MAAVPEWLANPKKVREIQIGGVKPPQARYVVIDAVEYEYWREKVYQALGARQYRAILAKVFDPEEMTEVPE